jgi:hypothetical protein
LETGALPVPEPHALSTPNAATAETFSNIFNIPAPVTGTAQFYRHSRFGEKSHLFAVKQHFVKKPVLFPAFAEAGFFWNAH